MFPSGLNETLKTWIIRCSLSVCWCLPVRASHRRIVPSWLPLASVLPSGLNDTLLTSSVCPLSVCWCLPVRASHRSMVSPPAKPPQKQASVVPSGLNTTLLPPPVTPLSLPVCASHRYPPLAIVLPSGLNDTLLSETEPSSVCWCLPVYASHKSMFLKSLLAIVFPSGLNATLLTSNVCPVSVRRCVHVFTSHRRIVPSSLPLASVSPPGLNATLTGLSVSIRRFTPVFTSHRRTVAPRCKLASTLTIVLLSGLNDTFLTTKSVYPSSVCWCLPVCASHRQIPLSFPLAIVFPSGLNETLKTQPRCPVGVCLCLPVWGSHRRIILSRPPLASVFPSGLNETLLT